MNIKTRMFGAAVSVAFSVSPLAMAQEFSQPALIQQLVPFQGRLHDQDNQVVANDIYNLTFRVYTTQTGGNHVWQEIHSSVSVIHGYVNVLLGASIPFENESHDGATVDFSQPLYLGISINGGAELYPRTQLVPSFHAYSALHAKHAESADTAANAIALGGIPATDYATDADIENIKDNFSGEDALNALKLDGNSVSHFATDFRMDAVEGKFDGAKAKQSVIADTAASATNATKLNNQSASFYATASSVTTLSNSVATLGNNFSGTKAKDADKLDGVDSSSFAKKDSSTNQIFAGNLYEKNTSNRVFSKDSIKTRQVGIAGSSGWSYIRQYPDGFTEVWGVFSTSAFKVYELNIGFNFTHKGAALIQLNSTDNGIPDAGSAHNLTIRWDTLSQLEFRSSYTRNASFYFTGFSTPGILENSNTQNLSISQK